MLLTTILYELRLKRRAIVGWAAIIVFWVALVAWAWSALGEGELQEAYEQLVKDFPEEFLKLFAKGVPPVYNADTFYVYEYFVIVVVLAVGAYTAYISAGSVVDDVLDKAGPFNLILPMPRWRLLLSRMLANITLVAIIMVVSLAVSIILLVFAVGRPITFKNMILLHLTGILYAASIVSLATLLGTILPVTIAKPASAGLVLAMYVLDTMTLGTSLEDMGRLTLTRYYPVLEIAVYGTLKTLDAAVLALTTIILAIIAVTLYKRKDLPV